MAVTTTSIGNEAELLARHHLEKAGYTILETKWRFKRLEVDIIAALPDRIVFVEVKFRRTDEFGRPELAVNKRKQAFMIAAANEFMISRDIDLEARFDVVSITGHPECPDIRHLEGAFFPVAR